jgi:glycosyltransferase involved in cell wall biosynthesis
MDYNVWADEPRGGCPFSTRVLVEGLKARGHEVTTINPAPSINWRPDYMRLVQEGKRFARGLRRGLRDVMHGPHVVIAQNHVYPYVVKECVNAGVPVVVSVRDIRYRCPNFAIPGGCHNPPAKGRCVYCRGKMAIIPYPWFRHHTNMLREMIVAADAQIVPSEYIAQDMRNWLHLDPVVIPPPVDDSHVPESWRPRDVLFMGKGIYKGADLVIEMAKALQHRTDFRFRVCGVQEPSHAFKFQALPNVDYLGFVDRCVAYERAAIHIAPARWQEPASRSVCEAQYIGIPSILNDAGGQAESMGQYGGFIIKDVEDVEDWTNHIELLMDNTLMWMQLSEIARCYGKEKHVSHCAKALEAVLEGVQ